MKRSLLLTGVSYAIVVGLLAMTANSQAAVVCSTDASEQEKLAAREVRRYVYLRTGELLAVVEADALPDEGATILVARKDRPIVARLVTDVSLRSTIDGLGPQQYVLKTLDLGDRRLVLIVGGDDVGALYGAYRFIEHLGVRFFMHGDVIPDKQIALELPEVDETGRPLFALRGVNPWGSHPPGFDLWNADDYKAQIGQLAKMRMNFLGVHCYPEGHPYAEPTVWLGLDGEFDERGQVRRAYPSRYYNTLWRGHWGPMHPKPTGRYSFGGSLLFDRDDWGPDVMRDHCPSPTSAEAANEIFNRSGELFREAFTFARLVGVKTCLGTESPLMMPKALRERLKAQGKDPADPAVVQEVYQGIFRRIAATHPLDYYWLWTPEGWTWQGNSVEQMQTTVADVHIALDALDAVDAPFRLATCGWVLGPKDDRAAFDRMIPKRIAVSAISRNIGHEPVDPAFGQVEGRDKWAIPWMEDDNCLSSPQLWVGRTRKDAADALAHGCTGLMGLQWRTRILGPNISALAQAGWDQSDWNPTPGRIVPAESLELPLTDGPLGGQTADYPNSEIAETEDDRLYQSCRYNLAGYRIELPSGRYRVTLKFCEPHFDDPEMRVCDVKLQGRVVIEKLDILARVGKFAALDYTFDDVVVSDGRLKLDIVHRESLPCISGIVVEGDDFTRKINCGGGAYKDYAADVSSRTPIGRGTLRGGLPSDDFWADWARAMFGPRAAEETAAVFQSIDGRLPRPASSGCPCGLRADPRPWSQVAQEYAFVDRLAACRTNVHGAGQLERFDYWLNTLRYLRSQGEVECGLGAFGQAMAKVDAEMDPAARKAAAAQAALPAYKELVDAYGRMYNYLLATVNTNGGLATVINLEHNGRFWRTAITATGQRLEAALGEPLPDDARPTTAYQGPPRLIVPTRRTSVAWGEPLELKVIVLSETKPDLPTLYWRELGRGPFAAVAGEHVGRGVYRMALPSHRSEADVEYYVEANVAGGSLRFPATAPGMNQTLVRTQ